MKLSLSIKSTNNGINIYTNFLISILKKLEIQYTYTQMPTITKRITLLKSPHVNKKAREQFELKIFKKIIIIKNKITLKILKLLVLNKPKFIKLKLRKII